MTNNKTIKTTIGVVERVGNDGVTTLSFPTKQSVVGRDARSLQVNENFSYKQAMETLLFEAEKALGLLRCGSLKATFERAGVTGLTDNKAIRDEYSRIAFEVYSLNHLTSIEVAAAKFPEHFLAKEILAAKATREASEKAKGKAA